MFKYRASLLPIHGFEKSAIDPDSSKAIALGFLYGAVEM